MSIEIKLPNFSREFSTGVRKEIRKKFLASMPSVAQKIEKRISVELFGLISQSQEFQDLKSNTQIRGELGLPSAASLDNIVQTWADGVTVVYTRNKIFGTLDIGMIQDDYSDVLSLPEASFVSASKKGSTVIEWLRWLLLESTSVIVSGYEFLEATGKGRTGLGFMIRKGKGWSVPAQYAGTATDNFATRALGTIDETIDIVVRQEITKGIR